MTQIVALGGNSVKEIYSFDEIKHKLDDAAKELKAEKFDCVFALARGGLVPGAIMGYQLDVPVLTATFSSEKGIGLGSRNDWFKSPFNGMGLLNILLVDDICDTGYTIKEITEQLKRAGHKVKSLTICAREFPSSGAIPDFFADMILDEVTWVAFPWED